MACKTISVLGAATQQVAIPSRLPQTQSDWQTFVQQLNTLFSQLSTTARRPAATSVPIQYATLFSATLPPLQTTNCTVTADNSWALFGGFSYKIVVTGANASVVCGASGFPLPIPPNENWLLSVYGKCSGASQSFKMGLQTANNTYQNTVITDATATTVDRFAIPLNLVADDASQCTLRLDFPSASGETFWFDGFQYEPSVTGSINPSPFLSTNIIAGSIVAQFITVAQLSALSANMGTLTAGKIQSSDGRFTIDCTNELITITDGTNTRMQIGEVSAGVYDVKIWNGSGTLLFDAATGLQYAGNSTQVTQVINNNSGNGQLNVNPTGGVTSNLPHANQSNQTLQVIANNGGNGQLNVNPTGGVVSTLPYANHDVSVKNTIVSAPDGNGSYLGHGVVFQPHIHANQIGWGHFIGDTSGNYSGNLVDGLNLRFLHGAMSTGVQGVISSGSQVNVNPSGGVTGNLPQANHDPTVLLSSVTGNQRNLIPDSGLKNVKVYWTDSSGGLITVTQNIDGATNCFQYTGTGSPSGFRYKFSGVITVQPGTYTLSAQGWVANITAGSMFVGVYDPTVTTNYGILSLSGLRAHQPITIPAGVTQVRVVFATNNATVANGQGSGVQDMQFEPGNVMTAYRENTGDNLSGTLLIDTGNSNHVGNWQHSYMSTPTKNTIATTVGVDGSYLNPGQVFNRHLNNATQSGLAGDAYAKQFQYGALAGRPAATGSGAIYHAYDAGTNGVTYRDNGVGSWVEVGVGHLADINGTTDNLAAGTSTNVVNQTNLTGGNVDLGKSGVNGRIIDNMADTANYLKTVQRSGNASAVNVPNAFFQISPAGVGNIGPFPGWTVDAGNPIVTSQNAGPTPAFGGQYLQMESTAAELEEMDTQVWGCQAGDIVTVGGAIYSYSGDTLGIHGVFLNACDGAFPPSGITTTSAAWSTTQTSNQTPPASAIGYKLRLYFNATASGHYAMFNWASASINDPRQPNSAKSYSDFTDNTSGGHIGKSNWADATQMGTNIQGGTSLTDGETITFANAYSADPEIVFGDGGLTYDSTLGAVSQFQDFSASFTHSCGQTTGFTAALKISTVGGALTNHSQNFASDSVTLSIAAGVIANGALTVSGSVHNSG